MPTAKAAPRTIRSVLADDALRALLDRHPLLPQDQQSFAAGATHRRAVDAIASGDFRACTRCGGCQWGQT